MPAGIGIKITGDATSLVTAVKSAVSSLVDIGKTAQNQVTAFEAIDAAASAAFASIANAASRATAGGRFQVFDTGATVGNLSALEKQIQAFGGGVKVASQANKDFIQSYTGFDAKAAAAAASIAKANAALRGLKPGANEAGQALQNIGRVAQDLPFGFIGIQNNLNPLLESFQRLKASTGTTSGALSALAGSLTGAGGIGLALSAVSAAITIATVGMGAWTRGFGDNTDAADENKKAIVVMKTAYEEYLEVLDRTLKQSAETAAKFNIIAASLLTSNTSLDDRKTLLKQLTEIAPSYVKGLDAEKSSYDEIKKSVDGFNESLAKNTEIKALLPEFEGLIKKAISAQVELNKLNRDQGFSGIFGEDDDFVKKEQTRLQDIIRGAKKEIEVAKKSLNSLAGDGFKLSDILFGKGNETSTGSKSLDKAIDEKIAGLKELQAQGKATRQRIQELFELKIQKINIDLPKSGLTRGEADALIGDMEKAAEEALKARPPVVNIPKIEFTTQSQTGAFDIATAIGGLSKSFGDLKVNTSGLGLSEALQGFAGIKTESEGAAEAMDVFTKKFLKAEGIANASQIDTKLSAKFKTVADSAQALASQLASIIGGVLVDSIAQVGVVIGDAISGIGIGDAVKGFLSILGNGLIEMGKATIQYAIQIGIIKKIVNALIAGGPLGVPLAIAAGVAAVALGTVLKNKVSKTKGFRDGGIADGPSSGYYALLHGKEVIAPYNQAAKLLGGGDGGTIQVVGRLVGNGRDLAAVIDSAYKINKRMGGPNK